MLENELLRILAAKGLTFDRDGRMVRIPGFAGHNTITDEQIRYCNERRGDHDIEARQRYNWVENLAQVVEEINQHGLDTAWPYLSVFWTRPVLAIMRRDFISA